MSASVTHLWSSQLTTDEWVDLDGPWDVSGLDHVALYIRNEDPTNKASARVLMSADGVTFSVEAHPHDQQAGDHVDEDTTRLWHVDEPCVALQVQIKSNQVGLGTTVSCIAHGVGYL